MFSRIRDEHRRHPRVKRPMPFTSVSRTLLAGPALGLWRRPGGAVLPWPAAGQFHLGRETQKNSDQYDDGQDANAGEGGLGGDGPDDVPGYHSSRPSRMVWPSSEAP